MPACSVIGVLDVAPPRHEHSRVDREHGIGSKAAQLANQLLAHDQVVGERSVGLVEERHVLVADDSRGVALLRFAAPRQFQWIEVRVLAALLAAGAADEVRDRSRINPPSDRAGRSEVRVIGMRDDHHGPLRPVRMGCLRGAFHQRFSLSKSCGPCGKRGICFSPRHRSSPPTSDASLCFCNGFVMSSGRATPEPPQRRLRGRSGRLQSDVCAADQAASSSRSADSTSSAWPSALTCGQTLTIWPLGSTRNVARCTPIDCLP